MRFGGRIGETMTRIPFDPKELEIVQYLPPSFPDLPPVPVYRFPISCKENFRRLLAGERPLWLPHINEVVIVTPSCIPDSWARGKVSGVGLPPDEKFGGPDMFGVQWIYDPVSGGSTVRPGNPIVKDLEHWEDYITFPDIEQWDWAASAEETRTLRSDGRVVKMILFSGLFERLISFVDMEDALVALIDEDMQPAVHRLFDRLCNFYDALFAKYKEYFQVDILNFHDDWGSQRAPFFSLNTVREMLLPYLKRCVDSAHRHGMIFEFHCCGFIEQLVPAVVQAGCDMLDAQSRNVSDIKKLTGLYGERLLIHSTPDDYAPDAAPEEKAAVIQKYLDDYTGMRTFSGMHPNMHEDEYRYIYELSRLKFT